MPLFARESLHSFLFFLLLPQLFIRPVLHPHLKVLFVNRNRCSERGVILGLVVVVDIDVSVILQCAFDELLIDLIA